MSSTISVTETKSRKVDSFELEWDIPCTPRSMLFRGPPADAPKGFRLASHKKGILKCESPSSSDKKAALHDAVIAGTGSPRLMTLSTRCMSTQPRNVQEFHQPDLPRRHTLSKSSRDKSVPWRIYADPMRQTSKHPPTYDIRPSVNFKGDLDVEQGNVISPVPLIVLPLGSVIEVACEYFRQDEIVKHE